MKIFYKLAAILFFVALAVALFSTAYPSNYEIVKIPKNTIGVFYVNHCPVRFFSSAPRVQFKFFSSPDGFEKIMNELGRISAKGRVIFENVETGQRQIYGKSSMYGGFIAKDSVRVGVDFIKSDKCQKYKLIVDEAFNEDVEIYVGNRYL